MANVIGYVSDERYLALGGVQVVLERGDWRADVVSGADGAVCASLEPGPYEVMLAKDGFGAKRVRIEWPTPAPVQFRLLADGLLGYVWPKWVKSGQRGEFRVHSAEAYKLSLWRYGLQKEHVARIGWFDEHGPRATVQTTPDGDYSQTGVGWNKIGYWHPHHKQTIPAPARSGLYFFHAQTQSGKFFSFPWIVAPATPTAGIAVLASNMNWNAYNSFGGRSNYIHPEGLPPKPTGNARMELSRYATPGHVQYDRSDYPPLSFDRPEPINHIPAHVQATDPIEGRAACHVAETEWRLLAWLEREGFSYDVYAETQLHFDELDLEKYRILILGPHPEYWSQKMYDRLKRWVREQGGRLMYLGGNGLNCDVEFLDPQTCIYRNEDNRRLLEPAGRFESRFHLRHESEANLLGVVYDDRGIMTAAPYEVVDAAHWIFQGTRMANGDKFGIHSLHERVPGGASGHETDKISPSSPPEARPLARGLNPDGGGAELVCFPAGRGAVFSTGSICWTSSLLVDDHVSKITRNVAQRFLDE